MPRILDGPGLDGMRCQVRGHWFRVVSILGLYRDNGKSNGNYYSILGLYRENGKSKGNYYSVLDDDDDDDDHAGDDDDDEDGGKRARETSNGL